MLFFVINRPVVYGNVEIGLAFSMALALEQSMPYEPLANLYEAVKRMAYRYDREYKRRNLSACNMIEHALRDMVVLAYRDHV